MNFELTVDIRPHAVQLTALGELDIFTARLVSRTLGAALDVGCRDVELDVAGVTFVDASALGVLARMYGALIADDATVAIVAPSPSFRRLCKMTALDTVFGLN